jgi:hypothetical protein
VVLYFPPVCPFAPTHIFSSDIVWNTACFALVTSHPRRYQNFPPCDAWGAWKVISQRCVSSWKTISKLVERPLAHVKFLHYFLERFVALSSFSDSLLCLNFFVLFPAWRCCCSILVIWPTNIHAGKSDQIIRT